LAELEKIKGTKKPVSEFIKNIHGKYYSRYIVNYDDDTIRYLFMLLTKALSYSTAKHPTTKLILSDVGYIAGILLGRSVVTKDNIKETYEFYQSRLNFAPNNLKETSRDLELAALSGKSFYVHHHGISEFAGFNAIHRGLLFNMYALYVLGGDIPKHIILNIPTESEEVQELLDLIQTQQTTYAILANQLEKKLDELSKDVDVKR
jgi:hypothetical protein